MIDDVSACGDNEPFVFPVGRREDKKKKKRYFSPLENIL